MYSLTPDAEPRWWPPREQIRNLNNRIIFGSLLVSGSITPGKLANVRQSVTDLEGRLQTDAFIAEWFYPS